MENEQLKIFARRGLKLPIYRVEKGTGVWDGFLKLYLENDTYIGSATISLPIINAWEGVYEPKYWKIICEKYEPEIKTAIEEKTEKSIKKITSDKAYEVKCDFDDSSFKWFKCECIYQSDESDERKWDCK